MGIVLMIVVAVVVIVALVAATLWSAQRRNRIVSGFGPEYQRAVAERGDRRSAERDLMDRVQQRDRLQVRELSADARAEYSQRWRAIQSSFVDDPTGALAGAERLLETVLRDLGYPADDYEQTTKLVSVDHPVVVQNYRAAMRISSESRSGQSSTEGMRDAFLNYRALFEELLEKNASAPA
jgi:FtsZ-interacting cell division protein ZipA